MQEKRKAKQQKGSEDDKRPPFNASKRLQKGHRLYNAFMYLGKERWPFTSAKTA